MIQGKKVLALIPARGGSKGVPGKNIRMLIDKPLLAWSIEAAKQSRYIDKVILSSDDDAIIECAKQWGCEVPFRRPAELATDEAPTMDAVLHALDKVPGFDKIVILQATSPLRNSEDIDRCLEFSMRHKLCVSVTETSKSPYWTYFKNEEHVLTPVLKADPLTRRQDLPKAYVPNGAIYIADVEEILHSRTLFTERTAAYEMPRERSIDIDTEEDFAYIEFLFSKKKGSKHASDCVASYEGT